MKAIILAAGRGSRMKNLTDERPKCLLEYHGRTLLDRQIDALRTAGIDEIAIVTGYRRDMLASRRLVKFHNPRWAETNMVSSLECANDWLQSSPCIVSYSDIVYRPAAVRSMLATSASLAVTYDPNWLELWRKRFSDPLLDAETLRISTDQALTEIGNKPKSIEEIQGQYMGLLRFTPEGWAELQRIRSALTPDQRDKMHMTGTLQMIIDAQRVPIKAIPYTGEWAEFDSAEDLTACD